MSVFPFERHPRYLTLSEVGRGAMGVVFHVLDEEERQEVALKTIEGLEPDRAYRLKQEFRFLAGLHHPNLVRLYDLVVADDAVFYTMELIEGRDAADWVRGETPTETPVQPGSLARLAPLLSQLSEGLGYLHGHGKIHRDLKPSNVLVDGQGRVVLLDFGLGSPAAADHLETTLGQLAGTLPYLPPERLYDAPPDAKGDWYALGVMLYEIVTGTLPFAGPVPLMMRQKESGAPRASELCPHVPPAIDELIARLLSPDPQERAGRDEVRQALTGLEGPSNEVPARPLPLPSAFVGRSRELALLARWHRDGRGSGPSLVEVTGPSGIGKTTLIEQWMRSNPGLLVLSGRCEPREDVPFKSLDAVIDDLTRHLIRLDRVGERQPRPPGLGALADLFPVFARVPGWQHPSTRGLAREPRERRRQGIEALRDLLARLAAREPLVIWIDDLQWGDRDSLPVLRALLCEPDAPDIHWIFSARSEEDSPALAALRELPLPRGVRKGALGMRPLSATESLSMAQRLLGQDAEHAVAIAEEAGGSPFFLDQLLRHHHRQQAEGRDEAPTRVEHVVLSRLDGLPPGAARLLATVCVAGHASRGLLRRVADEHEGLAELLHDLRATRLIQEGRGAVRPRHDRIQDAVLAVLEPKERQDLHDAVAVGLLAEGAPAARVLPHLLAAGDREQARTQAAAAAASAQAALAFERAAELYGLVLDLTDGPGPWDLLAARAVALANAGHGAAAGPLFQQAAAGCQEPARSWSLRLQAAAQLLNSGRFPEGRAEMALLFDQAGLAVPANPLAASLWGRLRLAVQRSPGGPREDPDLARQVDLLWAAARGTAMVEHTLGDALAVQALHQAVRLGDPVRLIGPLGHEAVSLANIGGPLFRKRSLRLQAQVRDLAAASGDPYDHAWQLTVDGACAFFRGQWTRAVESLRESGQRFREECIGASHEIGVADLFLMGALAWRGDLSELRARLPGLRAQADERGDLYTAVVLRLDQTLMAELAVDAPEQALETAAAALARWPAVGFTSQHYHHLVGTAQTLLYVGDGDAAWEAVEGLWPTLDKAGFLQLEALGQGLHFLRGRAALAGRRKESRGAREQALTQAEKILRRGSLPTSAPFAAALAAGRAVRDHQDPLPALAVALDGFRDADMALSRECARLALAVRRGDGPEHDRARAWFEGAAIARPEGMLELMLPRVLGDTTLQD